MRRSHRYVSEGDATEARASSAGDGWRLVGVLEWAPGFVSLGKPPSMASITRDTYASEVRFSAAEIRSIASGIARAMAHLHERGLAHGDLYAHNILWRRPARGTDDAAHKEARHTRRGRHGAHSRHARAAGAPTAGATASGAAVADAPIEGALTEGALTEGTTDGEPIAKLSDFGAAFYYGRANPHAAHYERFEQRAYGLLLEELLERHDGTAPERLTAVRAVARLATATRPDERPGFAVLARELAHELDSDTKLPSRRLRMRPRATFGRVLPHDHPFHHETGRAAERRDER